MPLQYSHGECSSVISFSSVLFLEYFNTWCSTMPFLQFPPVCGLAHEQIAEFVQIIHSSGFWERQKNSSRRKAESRYLLCNTWKRRSCVICTIASQSERRHVDAKWRKVLSQDGWQSCAWLHETPCSRSSRWRLNHCRGYGYLACRLHCT